MKATIYLVKNDLLTGANIPQETICINGECVVTYPYVETADELFSYMLLNRVRTGYDSMASFIIDTNVSVVSGVVNELFTNYKLEDTGTPVVITNQDLVSKLIDSLIDAGTEFCSMLTTYPDYPNCWDKLINYLIDNDMVPQENTTLGYSVVIDFKE